MTNFLTYIQKDIELKKEILSAMPTKTKTNQKALKDKINEFNKKYNEYMQNIRKYIDVKSKSIDITDNTVLSNQEVDIFKKRIIELHELKKILNPINTFYEKLEFDLLLSEIQHYSDFDFVTMNEIIKKFADKFNMINVKLTSNDFTVTSYVNEYMDSLFKAIEQGDTKYRSVEPIFEKIYWVNPAIIKHIELNFRQLIKKHEKSFNIALTKLQDEIKTKVGIFNYEECVKELKFKHHEFINSRRESISDIINASIDKKIDINDYFRTSKTFQSAFTNLVIPRENLDGEDSDEKTKTKLHSDLKRLKNIIEEYKSYIEFIPFVEYSKEMLKSFKNEKTLSDIENEIETVENEINEINKVIFGAEGLNFNIKKKLFGSKNKTNVDKPVKQLKIDLIVLADKLLELYKYIDSMKFLTVTKKLVNEYVTLDDFLNLYYGFDYFKKKGLKNTFKTTNYDELMAITKRFNEFCGNPNNVVISSVPIYSDYDVTKVIINKYRMNNINLNEENMRPANLDTMQEYIDIFLRTTHIMECNLTIDQIWFIVEATKIINKKSSN